jgi:DNA-binding LacI/PurR family transcriptional regulator
MNERITMKHIAHLAGVSQATVSLSLANHPRISERTRAHILSVARRLGYQPNPYVSALMRSRRRGKPLPGRPVLAIVCAYTTPHGWRDSPAQTIRQIHEGAHAQAEARGYQGQDVWLHQDRMSNERFSEMLHARGIQGVLLGPLPDNDVPPSLRWEHFSVVRVGLPTREPPLSAVCHDNYFGSMTTVQECHRLGYRRPGLVLRNVSNTRLQRRWEAGFLAGLRDLPDIGWVDPLISDQAPDLATFRAWLESQRPDVIVTAEHEAIARHLSALKRRVPQDIALASLSCPEAGSRISGVYQNGRLIGANAIDLLIGYVERHEKGLPAQATTLMVEGHWNAGETLVARRKPVLSGPQKA